jgi:hypothetical protein
MLFSCFYFICYFFFKHHVLFDIKKKLQNKQKKKLIFNHEEWLYALYLKFLYENKNMVYQCMRFFVVV